MYREFFRKFEGENLRFDIVYIPPSTVILIPTKTGYYLDSNEKRKIAFREGDIFIRRGTQSIPATEEEKDYKEYPSKTQESL